MDRTSVVSPGGVDLFVQELGPDSLATPPHRLRRPIVILHGAQDMGFPVQVAHRLHDAVPNATVRVVDRAGHMAHFDHPESWSSAVLDFLGA